MVRLHFATNGHLKPFGSPSVFLYPMHCIMGRVEFLVAAVFFSCPVRNHCYIFITGRAFYNTHKPQELPIVKDLV